ncbi:MAG: hypothetical protein NTZ09_06510 [Candidatus Hydrogenedentes bacterium]|nr:hypothetical protein [Candidatus Hydrogenedentota bacterium]
MSQLSRVCLATFVLTTAALSVLEPCAAVEQAGVLPMPLGRGETATGVGSCPDLAAVLQDQQIDQAVAQLTAELRKLKRASMQIALNARLSAPSGFEVAPQFVLDASVPSAVLLADGAGAAPDAAVSPPPPPRSSSPAAIPALPAMERMKQVLTDVTATVPPVVTDAAELTPVAAAAEPPAGEPAPAAPAPAEPAAPAVAEAAGPAPVAPAAAAPDAAAGPAAKSEVEIGAVGEPAKTGQSAVVATAPKKDKRPPQPKFDGDPLQQIVNIDFREMELSNVVALLAQKAQINVIAGSDLTGVVTANLRNVTLQAAIDTVLRMNGLGMVPESGVYHIVPYAQAVAAKRVTSMVRLENAKAADVRKTLDDILIGGPDATLVALSTNDTTNMLIVAGPEARVTELKNLAKELDVSKPVTPTVTEAIKINNAEPKELLKMVESMLSKDIGKAAVDERSRHIVVTDMPVVIEQVRALMEQVDMPVQQVSIDTMIVDAVLNDEAQTGVDWIVESVRHLNRRGNLIGNLDRLGLESDATGNPVTPDVIGPVPLSGRLAFSILSKDIDIRGLIGAEVRAQKARLLANPVITTVENKKAQIMITQEIPYQEFTQGLSGPPIATTAFKDVGIVLEVTPRVTHDDHVIADLSAKQSDTKGEINNIPIEDKRQTITTLRARNGQTIFIGGLRRFDDENQTRRIPVLGDIPIINALFRSNIITKESTELLVFLTCNVLPDEIAPLPLELEESVTELDRASKIPNAAGELGERIVHPKIPYADPAWKWRRPE